MNHQSSMMTDFRTQLAHRFRKQEDFADDYSPLSSRLFGIVADWLEAGAGDALVDWLLDVGNGRSPLDITLLLLAGLHRDVLNHEPEAAKLAQYYPSTGGKRDFNDAQLPQILRQTIMARRKQLTPFIQTAAVQTNETARGVCWLLPLFYTGWEAVHLVDLGASAGLNLVADARNYRLVDENGRFLIDLGNGQPMQFQMHCQGEFKPPASHLPHIITRTGGDLMPFKLETPADEQTLAAYVWADQPQRLARLYEGIAAFHQANRGSVPVHLYPVHLPNELPLFLETATSTTLSAGTSTALSASVPRQPDQPVVIYNTYMTAYLNDNGRSLQQHIANWAAEQNRPVLWLQWEPLWDGRQPPEYGWVAWTADLWQTGRHYRWHLAWNHPHGTAVHWLPGLHDWAAFWQEAT
jgi:hypothetical protein